MSKWPKLPRGSESPYESIGREKMEKPREAEEDRDGFQNRGCGNPRCEICYPENQGRDLGGINRPDTGARPDVATNYDDEFRRIRDEMMRSGRIMTFDVASPPPPPPSDAKLKELRKPIESFILTTPHDGSWDSFIGNEDAKLAMMEAIEASTTHKEIYEYYGMKPSKGVVLYGPPGCGKTMLGKLVASAISRLHKTSAEMILIGQDIESPFIGVTEAKIAAIFAYAREYHKVHGHQLTIFIDEADSLLPQRGSAGNWKNGTVNAFLGEMDGLADSGAFVILASNRIEAMDEALMRDGRCSRKIKVVRPGYEEAKQMIYNALRTVPIEFDLDNRGHNYITQEVLDYFVHPARIVTTLLAINRLTEQTMEINITLANIMNGAMLTTLVERAKSFAFRRDIASGVKSGITMLDLTSAVDELVKENSGIPHRYALEEMLEALDLNLKDENKEMRRKMN